MVHSRTERHDIFYITIQFFLNSCDNDIYHDMNEMTIFVKFEQSVAQKKNTIK